MFAQDAAQALKEQLGNCCPKKLYVLASERAFRVAAKALKEMGQSYVLCTGCMSNPTADFVNDCAEQVRAEKCNFLLAIGGGSVIDAAKAIPLGAMEADGYLPFDRESVKKLFELVL